MKLWTSLLSWWRRGANADAERARDEKEAARAETAVDPARRFPGR